MCQRGGARWLSDPPSRCPWRAASSRWRRRHRVPPTRPPQALPDAARTSELADLRRQEYERRNIYEVRFPDAATARRAAITFHDGLLGSDIAHATLTIELDDGDLARLRRDGYAHPHRRRVHRAARRHAARAGERRPRRDDPGAPCGLGLRRPLRSIHSRASPATRRSPRPSTMRPRSSPRIRRWRRGRTWATRGRRRRTCRATTCACSSSRTRPSCATSRRCWSLPRSMRASTRRRRSRSPSRASSSTGMGSTPTRPGSSTTTRSTCSCRPIPTDACRPSPACSGARTRTRPTAARPATIAAPT